MHPLRHIRIVLVRPRGALNVGSVARVMKNMGLTDLALVRPAYRAGHRAAAMAVHARDVLDNASAFPTLAAAIADCGVVVGTTCREGLYRAHAGSPDVILPFMLKRSCQRPAALVFGPENHGLNNEDLKLCQRLIRIPTAPEYPSLNLSHAVAVCCYELHRLAREVRPLPFAAAAASEIEFAMNRLEEAFLRIGFLNRDNPDHIMFALRRIFGRAGLERRDVRILLGLARQILWYGSEGWKRDRPAPLGAYGKRA